MKTRRHDPPLESLAAYLEGEVTASESAALEAQLAETPAARRRLDRLRDTRDALGAPIPELEGVDLTAGISRALRAPAPSARRRAPLWAAFMTAGALAAAGAVGAVALWPRPSDEFRAKSASGGDSQGGGRADDRAAERWAGVQVYHVDGSGKPRRVGDRVSAREGLTFSYTNLGPRPFESLMIFAVDARGEVRWFYPAYQSEGTNPASVPIKRGEAEVALSDAVYHDLPAGPLVLYGVFSHRPLRVLEVESVVGGAHGAPSRLPFPDVAVRRLTTQIDP
jgi:hypothetical protein